MLKKLIQERYKNEVIEKKVLKIVVDIPLTGGGWATALHWQLPLVSCLL